MDGRSRNAACHDWRTVLVEPHCVPGKLFHTEHQIPGFDLDGFCRSGTNEKSHVGTACGLRGIGETYPVHKNRAPPEGSQFARVLLTPPRLPPKTPPPNP